MWDVCVRLLYVKFVCVCVRLLYVKFVCVCVKWLYVRLLYVKFVCVRLLYVKFVCVKLLYVKFVCVWSYCMWDYCMLSLCVCVCVRLLYVKFVCVKLLYVKFVCVKLLYVRLLYVKFVGVKLLLLYVWGRRREEKEPGIQNQKQEPHTKLWGIKKNAAARGQSQRSKTQKCWLLTLHPPASACRMVTCVNPCQCLTLLSDPIKKSRKM